MTEVNSQDLIPPRDEPPRVEDDEEDDVDAVVQSGQVRQQQQQDEEFEEMSFLTQYIGPPTSRYRARTLGDSEQETMFQDEVKKYTTQYRELVDTMDRASSHKRALQQAI